LTWHAKLFEKNSIFNAIQDFFKPNPSYDLKFSEIAWTFWPIKPFWREKITNFWCVRFFNIFLLTCSFIFDFLVTLTKSQNNSELLYYICRLVEIFSSIYYKILKTIFTFLNCLCITKNEYFLYYYVDKTLFCVLNVIFTWIIYDNNRAIKWWNAFFNWFLKVAWKNWIWLESFCMFKTNAWLKNRKNHLTDAILKNLFQMHFCFEIIFSFIICLVINANNPIFHIVACLLIKCSKWFKNWKMT